VDPNDVGDPFIIAVPPGLAPPTDVPFQVRGPDAYVSAPWGPAQVSQAEKHGWYVLFGTPDWQSNVPTAISTDLVHWTEAPDSLPDLPAWATPNYSMTWAPAAQHLGSNWIMYYSTEDAALGTECIGRATSTSPAGPYRDASTLPLECQPAQGGSIDPSVVTSGTSRYLVWKNDGNSDHRPDTIWTQQLRSDGLGLVGSDHQMLGVTEPWEKGIVEAPAMLAAPSGGYWLFFSGGNWSSNQYATGLAYCRAITGPCAVTTDHPYLATTESMVSPGGLDTFSDLQGRLWVAFTALVAMPSPWHPGHVYYNRVLDVARVLAR
jgi:beta-xylosidase